MKPELELPIGLFAVLRPKSLPVLAELGIDLPLEHTRPLEEACAMRDVEPRTVLDLVDALERGGAYEEADWSSVKSSPGVWSPAQYEAGVRWAVSEGAAPPRPIECDSPRPHPPSLGFADPAPLRGSA
jgi:hypothetical protein